MKRVYLPVLSILIAFSSLAQKQKSLTPEQRKIDEAISKEMIWPVVNNAKNDDSVPDWDALKKEVVAKYDVASGERAVIRGKIFYYFGKDWQLFNENLVEYTEKYEDPTDAPLMNKNASMILKHSTDKKQLEKALGWTKRALNKDPHNADYQKTNTDLKSKIASL